MPFWEMPQTAISLDPCPRKKTQRPHATRPHALRQPLIRSVGFPPWLFWFRNSGSQAPSKMRFKFCGDADAPDWLLAEIATISKLARSHFFFSSSDVILFCQLSAYWEQRPNLTEPSSCKSDSQLRQKSLVHNSQSFHHIPTPRFAVIHPREDAGGPNHSGHASRRAGLRKGLHALAACAQLR